MNYDRDTILAEAQAAFEQGSYEKAYALYHRDALCGYAESQIMLGWMHETGTGTDKDENEAVKWYSSAIELGDKNGAFYLADLLDKQDRYKDAGIYYKVAAEFGNSIAAYRIGALYTKYATSEPAFWLEKSARSGNVFAMALLGRRMMFGDVPGGLLKGIKYFLLSIFMVFYIVITSNLKNPREDPRLRK